jgi:hypothetical protein
VDTPKGAGGQPDVDVATSGKLNVGGFTDALFSVVAVLWVHESG